MKATSEKLEGGFTGRTRDSSSCHCLVCDFAFVKKRYFDSVTPLVLPNVGRSVVHRLPDANQPGGSTMNLRWQSTHDCFSINVSTLSRYSLCSALVVSSHNQKVYKGLLESL